MALTRDSSVDSQAIIEDNKEIKDQSAVWNTDNIDFLESASNYQTVGDSKHKPKNATTQLTRKNGLETRGPGCLDPLIDEETPICRSESGSDLSDCTDTQESAEDTVDDRFTTASKRESILAFKSRPVGSFRVSISGFENEDQENKSEIRQNGGNGSLADRTNNGYMRSGRETGGEFVTMGNAITKQNDTICSSIDQQPKEGMSSTQQSSANDVPSTMEYTTATLPAYNVPLQQRRTDLADYVYRRIPEHSTTATVEGDYSHYLESYAPEVYPDPELCGLTSASNLMLHSIAGYSQTNTPSANVTPCEDISSPVFDYPDSPARPTFISSSDPRFMMSKSSSDNYITAHGQHLPPDGFGTTATTSGHRHGLAWSLSTPGPRHLRDLPGQRPPHQHTTGRRSLGGPSKPLLRFPGIHQSSSRVSQTQPTPPAAPPPALVRSLSTAAPVLRTHIQHLNSESTTERLSALREILVVLDDAWSMPVVGKELAYKLCDILRTDGGVRRLIELCDSDDESRQATVEEREVRRLSAKVLSRSMVVNNRDYIARNHIETLVRLFDKVKDDCELSQAMTKILECLFKDSKSTCTELIALGALDTLLYFCKALDTRILRNCAGALANLSLYGGSDNQRLMVEHNAQLWLFPLAFSMDDSIRYYALLAIAALSANKELEQAVVESGTLQLVEQFLRSHDPEQFGQSDSEHIHGQSDTWVHRLVPILRSSREEAVSLAAFHFAMEAGIRQKKGDIALFKSANIVRILKRLASSSNRLAARFASQALRIAGEQIPRKLSTRVSLWTTDDVACWLHQLGMGDHVIRRFEECQVDGDLLMLMNEQNLASDIRMSNGITRLRFLRELDELKQNSDYTMYDSSNLNQFLRDIHPELCRYTYRMLKSRVSLALLPQLTEQHLSEDCGVNNGVHRLIIMNAAKSMSDIGDGDIGTATAVTDTNEVEPRLRPDYDAFISYRRSCGSLLASLLKVYLEIRGFRVFLDIDGMLAGKFDENLLKTIAHSKNFLLVLSPNTLDRCIGDNEVKDWVHKELVAAIESQCKIIPVVQEGHVFPDSELLPADIRCIEKYQAIMWNSDFHEACIDKLVRYMCDQEPAALVHPTISKDRSISRESASSGSRT